ncbi:MULTISPECIES: peptide deformylase [Gammaproteobacteria]|uniref:peptide deformylase n=1 Tax=Gammaproteobacteria TaxID=1236 RepID=UPI000C75E2C9|nr:MULTISPECIES: peptide deformylase [Gammaproteobacteria]MBO9480346.1 peptide deformylase [Salinisphaera sp. G21_0]MBO9493732.1 peptide deformylase [Thalassotalea sp. G20_0]WBA81767.1 peptide deformylase [Endozoicomonas sp. GU-1]WBA84722.1 peptide deformylase [Endozoicomonas sp. GU-1]
MALLEILEYPDQRLRTVAKPVAEVNDDIRRIVDDMLETMYDAKGVGLAATQVDIHQRIVVMDLSEEGNEPQVLINPGYEPIGDEKSDFQEGCLSVPGFYELLDRYAQVRLTALDRDGNEYTRDYDGLAAVCVQHELDHLEGKLFIDTLSRLKQDRIRKKLGKRKH